MIELNKKIDHNIPLLDTLWDEPNPILHEIWALGYNQVITCMPEFVLRLFKPNGYEHRICLREFNNQLMKLQFYNASRWIMDEPEIKKTFISAKNGELFKFRELLIPQDNN